MCGANLAPEAPAKTPSAPAGPAPPGDTEVADPAGSNPARGSAPDARPPAVNLDLGFEPQRREDAAAAASSHSQRRAPWRQEVSDRVLSFQRRRAKLRNESPQEQNLDFEFERSETTSALEPEVEGYLEFPQDSGRLDAEIGRPAAFEDEALEFDAGAREANDEVFEIPDSRQPRAQDFELEPESGGRLEIVVVPAESESPTVAPPLEPEALQVASMSSRFLAGLIDGLILLLSAGLFDFILLFAGVHLARVPLNLAVMAVIAGIFIGAYLGMFTALTSSTPGQSWMGIAARNMQGWPPDTRESLLRAFGYLVSLSAFMLGFLWALVDGESLTWHDRISGTFLTPVTRLAPAKGVKSTS
jgi:uncharacterized RDD family membrane protein YckC